MIRLVLDASVLVRAVKPKESGHKDCVEVFKLLHEKVKAGEVELYEPPEFILEIAANLQRQRLDVDSTPLNYLTLENPLNFRDIPFVTEKDVTNFIRILKEKYNDQAFKTKAADIIYLSLSWRIDAILVSADEGLLKYADHFNVLSPKKLLSMFGISKRKIWSEKNKEKIRASALASYHRNKKSTGRPVGRPPKLPLIPVVDPLIPDIHEGLLSK